MTPFRSQRTREIALHHQPAAELTNVSSCHWVFVGAAR
jgi:hypothetical protein